MNLAEAVDRVKRVRVVSSSDEGQEADEEALNLVLAVAEAAGEYVHPTTVPPDWYRALGRLVALVNTR